MKYIIITPAKDEAKNIRNTLDSVIKQTLLPLQWIIVNDGSTDNTGDIVNNYAKRYSWITLLNNSTENEERSEGSKIINAFYYGYHKLKKCNYDFIVKLDADLTLPRNYFEKVSREFESDSRIGMCGGFCSIRKNGDLKKERSVKYHLRGAIKAYRKKCFENIGGIKPILGWDGLDEMTAMYKGWKVRILDIEVELHRKTNESYSSLELHYKRGRSLYKMGSTLPLMLIRIAVRIKNKPYLIASLAMLIGYIKAFINQEEKHVDKDLGKFINNFHYARICGIFRR